MAAIVKLKKEKAGTLISSALLMPVFIMLAAFVIDIGGSLALKADLYKACLVSAQEASKIIDMEKSQIYGLNNISSNYKDVIEYYFSKNFFPVRNASLSTLDCSVINSIQDPMYVLVKGQAKYKTFFLKIIGIEEIKVRSQALGRLRKIK